jgi:hypothetical protein
MLRGAVWNMPIARTNEPERKAYAANSSSSAFASFRSPVSNPSVNHVHRSQQFAGPRHVARSDRDALRGDARPLDGAGEVWCPQRLFHVPWRPPEPPFMKLGHAQTQWDARYV